MTLPRLTLVETLVGLALLGLVSALSLSTLGLVGRVGTGAAAEATSVALAQDQLKLPLRAALPVLTEESSGRPILRFEGEPKRVALVARLPTHFGVSGFAVVEVRRKVEALAIRWPPLLGEAEGEGAAGHVLPEGVAVLRLCYFGAPRGREQATWLQTWTEAAMLPVAASAKVDFAGGVGWRWPGLVVALRLAVPAGAATP